jgi:hypothetical protein
LKTGCYTAEKVDIAKMVVGDEWIARVDSEMDVGDELGVGDGLFLSLTLRNK